MSAAAAFAVAGLSITILCFALGLAIALRRSVRLRSTRRDDRLADPFRPLLVRLVVDDDPDPTDVERVLAADRRTWRALEPVVVAMVRKLRGEAREALVDLLRRRGTIDRHARRLHRWGAVGRARSAELLGLLGEQAPGADLARLLEHDRDPEVRIVAARALGEVGDPAAAGVLLRSVSGPRAVPLRIVARSLARLGPAAAPALVAALDSPDVTARTVAAEILGLTGALSAVGPLSQHLLEDPDEEVRIRCARALGRIGVPSAIAVLEVCLALTESEALRAVATRAVGDVGGHLAVQVLQPLLQDPQHRVASNAARALGGLGPTAIAVLREVAAGDGPGARYAAEAVALHDIRPRGVSTVRP